MRAYQPWASKRRGWPPSSQYSTATCRERFTSALNPARLRQPSKKLDLFLGLLDDAGVDENLKRNCLALAFPQTVGRNVFGVFGAVFDHRELERQTHLWRSQAHAGGIAHGFVHPNNELLCFRQGDLFLQ